MLQVKPQGSVIYLGKAVPATGNGGKKPQYVAVLPETGKEGILYLVNTGTTRDGYAIFQEFAWHSNEWIAIGAFDVGIAPTGIMYVQSFDASTNTLNTTASL